VQPPANPRRGDIWLLNLNPTVGSEIQKRPALVISSDAFAATATRIIVPLTGWQDRFVVYPNKLKVPASALNGLDKDSAMDVLQIRCVALERFGKYLGRLEADLVDEAAAGVVVAIDYYPG